MVAVPEFSSVSFELRFYCFMNFSIRVMVAVTVTVLPSTGILIGGLPL